MIIHNVGLSAKTGESKKKVVVAGIESDLTITSYKRGIIAEIEGGGHWEQMVFEWKNPDDPNNDFENISNDIENELVLKFISALDNMKKEVSSHASHERV